MIALLFLLPIFLGAFIFDDSNSSGEPETDPDIETPENQLHGPEINGNYEDNTLSGTNRIEVINGNEGNDTITGLGRR